MRFSQSLKSGCKIGLVWNFHYVPKVLSRAEVWNRCGQSTRNASWTSLSKIYSNLVILSEMVLKTSITHAWLGAAGAQWQGSCVEKWKLQVWFHVMPICLCVLEQDTYILTAPLNFCVSHVLDESNTEIKFCHCMGALMTTRRTFTSYRTGCFFFTSIRIKYFVCCQLFYSWCTLPIRLANQFALISCWCLFF